MTVKNNDRNAFEKLYNMVWSGILINRQELLLQKSCSLSVLEPLYIFIPSFFLIG